eukprot:3224844-Rhodomonas_salina.6
MREFAVSPYALATRCPSLTSRMVVAPLSATRCPVLTQRMEVVFRHQHKVEAENPAEGKIIELKTHCTPTRCLCPYARPMKCPVLTSGSAVLGGTYKSSPTTLPVSCSTSLRTYGGICLCACYDMSGTDISYRATCTRAHMRLALIGREEGETEGGSCVHGTNLLRNQTRPTAFLVHFGPRRRFVAFDFTCCPKPGTHLAHLPTPLLRAVQYCVLSVSYRPTPLLRAVRYWVLSGALYQETLRHCAMANRRNASFGTRATRCPVLT